MQLTAYTVNCTDSDRFYRQHLFEDEFCCICRQGHPGLDENGSFSLESFLEYSHVLVSKTGVGLAETDRALQQLGKTRQIAMTTQLSALVPPFVVLETDLIATTPRKTAHLMQRYLPIEVTNSPLTLSSFQLDLAWGPLAQHSSPHRWLRQIIIEEARTVL